MDESFGALLRRFREAAALTQEALAERASVSSTAIAALERGRNRAPRLSTLRQLGRALDLSAAELAQLSTSARLGRLPPEPGVSAPDVRGPMSRVGEIEETATPGIDEPPQPKGLRGEVPAAAQHRWRSDFVGRSVEYDRLQAAWKQRRRLIEVVGESGIGKTRLVAELARRANEDGTVLWGRCSPDGLGSYLPFVEVLRQLVAEADLATLSRAVGASGELTRLVPELTERLGALPLPARAEAGSEQRLLFDAVSSVLAPWLPTLLVIDDLHWADSAALAMVRYLARDHRLDGLVIAVTARPIELSASATAVLVELGRDTETERIELVGLDDQELTALVSDVIGAPAPAALVRSVASATEGNPFFAEELTVHMLDTGAVVDTVDGVAMRASSAGVPNRVRATVAERLRSLSVDAATLLSVGAVVGREFDLAVVAAASGLTGVSFVDAADDCLMSGMVVEPLPGRLAFSHALVRDAVTAGLSFVRAAAIHRRVAEAIEGGWPRDPAVAADLARHWAAVTIIDPTATVAAATWAVRAGDVALASAAPDEAISRFEQAAALWAPLTAGHVDSLIRLGMALQHRGRSDDADVRFREAHELAVSLRDSSLQARAAIGLGRRYPYWETDTGRIEALEAALSAVPPVDRELGVVLMGLLVTHMIIGFEPEHARRRDRLADEIAAIATDPSTEPEVLLAVGQTRVYDCIEDPTTLAVVADRLMTVAVAHRDLRAEIGATFARALAALDLGDRDMLLAACEHHETIAARLDDPRDHSQSTLVRSTMAFIEGRYDDAEALSDQAYQLGQAGGDVNAELLHYGQGLLRGVDQGLAGDILPLLLAATDYQHIAAFEAGTALCAALAGDHLTARRLLDQRVRSGFVGAPRGADWIAPTAFLAHTCTVIGDESAAAWLYTTLSTSTASVVRVGPLAGWWGPIDHHLGCLARILGRFDEAEHRLRRALAIEDRLNARPFAARTTAELARVLLRTRPAQGRAMADAAAALAADVRAAGIIDEVASTLAA